MNLSTKKKGEIMQPIKISDNIRRIISDKEIEILNLRPIPYEMLKLNDFHYIGQILEFENVIHKECLLAHCKKTRILY